MLNKSPIGVKSEDLHYLLGACEVDSKTGESYESMLSMFTGWLIEAVNALEKGITVLKKEV